MKGIPFIAEDNAKTLYDFIIKNKCKNILELGIAYGTSSAYIAAALDELGEGELTCVDLEEVRDKYDPSAENLLAELGFSNFTTIERMKSGYNWFLHDKIKASSINSEQKCQPIYDLIIIDGPKNWTIDSSSFFLCDKLLKQEGWILWDDYNWSYKDAGEEVTDGITKRSLSLDEQSVPHIKEIFHLLVMQHENYGNFIIQEDSGWAWAQTNADTKKVRYTSTRSIQSLLVGALKKLFR